MGKLINVERFFLLEAVANANIISPPPAPSPTHYNVNIHVYNYLLGPPKLRVLCKVSSPHRWLRDDESWKVLACAVS